MNKIENKKIVILNILNNSNKPLSGSKIAKNLISRGMDISERTVRLYLLKMDEEGLTINKGKLGRKISEKGVSVLNNSRILERVGFLSAKIDQMTYKMTFDLTNRTGTVVTNISIVDKGTMVKCLPSILKVFEKGFAMGDLTTLFTPGENINGLVIPKNMIGFGTVCSITLNGVLLKYGVPTHSRFGGLLELINYKPVSFVEIINYNGTTIDPLVIFIRSGMTDYLGAIKNGNGKIGASFREIPAESRDLVLDIAKKLKKIGLGGFMDIGYPGTNLLDIPVDEGRAGAIVIGGLNPAAIFEETNKRVFSRALAGHYEISRMFHFDKLEKKLKSLI